MPAVAMETTGGGIARLLTARKRGKPYVEHRRWSPCPATIRQLLEWNRSGGKTVGGYGFENNGPPWTDGRLDWTLLREPRRRAGRSPPISLSQFPARAWPMATPPDTSRPFAVFCEHGVKLLEAAKIAFDIDEPLAPAGKLAFVQAVDRQFKKLAGGEDLDSVMGSGSQEEDISEWHNGVMLRVWEIEGFNDDHVSGLLELMENCRDLLGPGRTPEGRPQGTLRLPAAAVETLCPGSQVRIRTDGREEVVTPRDRVMTDATDHRESGGAGNAGASVIDALELKRLEAVFTKLVLDRRWKALGRKWNRALTFLADWHGMIFVNDMSAVDVDIDYFGGLADMAEECRLLRGMREATWPLIRECNQERGGGEAFWRSLARRLKRVR